MCLWAIVPVRPLRRAKSRLSDILTSKEREQLNFEMLETTLKALSMVPEIGKVLVVSSDMSALALARDYNARTLLEDGHTKLNTALSRATTLARAYAAGSILFLAADLPMITEQDLHSFLALSQDSSEVIIAPDRHGTGTNALYVRPPGLIRFAFGTNSFQRHLNLAKQAGAKIEVVNSPAFALDIDTPQDVVLYNQLKANTHHLMKFSADTLNHLEAK